MFFNRLVFFVILLHCVFLLRAQVNYVLISPRNYKEYPARNAFFIELGGNMGLYSLNFDRIYFYKKQLKISSRVGIASHLNGVYVEPEAVLENNFILLKNPHHLELGFGITLHRRYNEIPNKPDNYFWENIWFSVWRCGYRFQKQEDGFFFRIGLTPVIMSKDIEGLHSNYFQLWAGLSVGVSF